ncbi:hypothetical protein MsAg5_04450 [Methanosarcinaceae archaeon Ag5]|uniref:DUF4411 family protein n=1 Tax=Methanolapillus africanus TaxID=3028297 RepID=A0AAE4MIK3_9EURY|nr:hypothetical protein [Methanosarcinaceae archaeon Ag5]
MEQMILRDFDSESAQPIYVFDTGVISQLFRNYYPETFPSLWKKFNRYVLDGNIISVREVKREIERLTSFPEMTVWTEKNKHIFSEPDQKEFDFLAGLFQNPAARDLVNPQNVYNGLPAADPFVISKAYATGGTVVTTEKLKPNARKIPNICQEYSVPCLNLADFFKKEKWTF